MKQASRKRTPVKRGIRISISKPARQVIRILPNGKVKDRKVPVRKGASEDVEWVAKGNGGPWTVKFDKVQEDDYPDAKGSPFSDDTYRIPKGESEGTEGGPFSGKVGWTYKYNVYDKDGTRVDDPDIDIES